MELKLIKKNVSQKMSAEKRRPKNVGQKTLAEKRRPKNIGRKIFYVNFAHMFWPIFEDLT